LTAILTPTTPSLFSVAFFCLGPGGTNVQLVSKSLRLLAPRAGRNQTDPSCTKG
jgi:hypothetical protein